MDNLRAFAGQVRGLLSEFQESADGPTTHTKSGVGRGSFGEFAEATALHDQYDMMRDGLRDVLTALHGAIDEAQRKADLTATNYEEQEQHTKQRLKVTSDGWSVASPVTYGAAAAGMVTGASAGRSVASRAAVKNAGQDRPTDVDAATGAPMAGPAGGPVTAVPGAAGKGNSARPEPGGGAGPGKGGVEQPTW
ncbi:hypothetical protein [Kitasatospora azatica]|uniref:hypothetical protein n=1 Tax=Kitasatospora azatica TaxID=58347 RepID=UPI00055A8B9E|nr:hypothetical protein [Kitasatospora azatica]